MGKYDTKTEPITNQFIKDFLEERNVLESEMDGIRLTIVRRHDGRETFAVVIDRAGRRHDTIHVADFEKLDQAEDAFDKVCVLLPSLRAYHQLGGMGTVKATKYVRSALPRVRKVSNKEVVKDLKYKRK